MKIHFYSPNYIENWDFRNTIDIGIGGSETSHVEMAWRFARRGYEVISYSPINDDCPRFWKNVEWKHLDEADFSEPGLWIIYRNFTPVDNFNPKRDDQYIWIVSQDTDCAGYSDERAEKIDYILSLCTDHTNYIAEKYPKLRNKIFQTSNGIKTDLIREIFPERTDVKKYSRRLIYTSSPDRGLVELLQIFKRAREYVDDLELHVFYGFDNIKNLLKKQKNYAWKKTILDVEKYANQPGVTLHGRVGQKQLYEEFMKSGIWCYPTTFSESSCISCLEAQALGAIPITNPYWALRENVKHGIFIMGDPKSDPLVKARYVQAIVQVASSPEGQFNIQQKMMGGIRALYNWDVIVDRWDYELLQMMGKLPRMLAKSQKGFDIIVFPYSQFAFQHKHLRGKTLNIGCNIDASYLRARKNVTNLDIITVDPCNNREIPADIVADARNLPENLYNQFDTAILGDILEHFPEEEEIVLIEEAKKILKPDGQLIITVPSGRIGLYPEEKPIYYKDNIPGFHITKTTKEHMLKLVEKTNMEIIFMREIDYGFSLGYGLLLKKKEEENN